MADGTVTVTGLKELSAAIDRLPATVTAQLRAVAWRTSRDVMTRAKQLAPVGAEPRLGHTAGQPHLRDSIIVEEVPSQKLFRVFPNTPWLPNLGLWIERGTRYMRARPFMRPAGDAVDAQYKSESLKAAAAVVDDLGNL